MKWALLSACLATTLAAQTEPHPTGNRTTPPIVNSVAPQGVARGATLEMNVEGLNLAGAKAVYFSEPGITARIVRIKELPDLPEVRLGSNNTPSTIDLGPLPPRNQVTLELDVGPEAPVGPVSLRLLTPLGTSPAGRFLVEPYFGESPDREPNETPEQAFESYLPTILVGTITRPGDLDHYKVKAAAGEEIVFENAGAALGSALQPVLSILDEKLGLVAQYRFPREKEVVRHRFETAGAYFVRIADYQESGSARHFYRIKAGRLQASHLQPVEYDESTIGAAGALAFDGNLTEPAKEFRFRARKGQKFVIEVAAARLGSPLDSLVEVLDAQGRPIERATVRCVLETSTTLAERDSSQAGIRITSPVGFAVGDYMMIGREIIRVEAMPRTPDDDFRFENFNGQRIAYYDTSTEAHAVDKPVYKVQIHPPGAQFAPNGLPIVRLTYKNDDGGPGFGKDSRLRFTAPADGEYVVKMRDVRGAAGEEYTYKLTIREPSPDFRLSAAPANPNVPLGGRIPVTVTAFRMDDFDGPIEVSVDSLPAGLTATKGTIAPGQISTTILLHSGETAKLDQAVPFTVTGRAGNITRTADPDEKLKLIAVMPRPDIQMLAQTKEVVLEPGGTAEVKVAITRNNEYGGRVPVEVRNLPPGVRVLDVGLNGVLINEDENERSFVLEALPNAEPIEQSIVVSGRVETRSPQQTSYAAEPLTLRVKPPTRLSSR
jgi:hypothetical protein